MPLFNCPKPRAPPNILHSMAASLGLHRATFSIPLALTSLSTLHTYCLWPWSHSEGLCLTGAALHFSIISLCLNQSLMSVILPLLSPPVATSLGDSSTLLHRPLAGGHSSWLNVWPHCGGVMRSGGDCGKGQSYNQLWEIVILIKWDSEWPDQSSYPKETRNPYYYISSYNF